MAAEVSTQMRGIQGDNSKNKRDLVTRDFLSCAVTGSKELDLDIKVPLGWERHLDLQSGETTYIEKCKYNSNLQDLNLPAASKDDSTLDLQLLLQSCPKTNFQSVCTLEKVRLALERAGHGTHIKKRGLDGSDSSSSSSSSSSRKRRTLNQGADDVMESSDSSEGLVATGCPSCLMFVMISKEKPNCPRCNSQVPDEVVSRKKPRIDLNCL